MFQSVLTVLKLPVCFTCIESIGICNNAGILKMRGKHAFKSMNLSITGNGYQANISISITGLQNSDWHL